VTYDVDAVFSWHSEDNSEPNACRLNIHWLTWEKAIVIATEVTHNPGKQMHDATLEIIEFAKNFYDLASNKMMLLEHYQEESVFLQEIYFQIVIVSNEVIRYEIDKSDLIQLIGKTI